VIAQLARAGPLISSNEGEPRSPKSLSKELHAHPYRKIFPRLQKLFAKWCYFLAGSAMDANGSHPISHYLSRPARERILGGLSLPAIFHLLRGKGHDTDIRFQAMCGQQFGLPAKFREWRGRGRNVPHSRGTILGAGDDFVSARTPRAK
jgi:hypothetical protein